MREGQKRRGRDKEKEGKTERNGIDKEKKEG